MKQLIYFFTFFLLLSCGDLTNNDFFGSKNSEDVTDFSDTITTKSDSLIFAENVSPDGSWQININLKEGYFWGYSVVYNTGKITTKKINSGIVLTGKMNNPKAKWINDSTYKIQNIGITGNGHYELVIYKSAACKYTEHFKEEIDSIGAADITDIDNSSTNQENKESETINLYSQTDNFIVFTQTIKNFGNPNNGSSSSESSLSLVIQNYTDSFEYSNEGLNAVKLNYSYSGGLHDISGDKPFKGYLKGKLLPDNTWKIELDVWISTFSYVDNEKGKKQLKTSGIFLP